MVLTIKILWDLEMFGAHNKDTWGPKNVCYSQKNTWGARNAWYSQKILGELERFGTHNQIRPALGPAASLGLQVREASSFYP